jgi:hypothetical protein
MRTTIDLPDELLRRAKAAAALQGIKLKDLVACYIEQGLVRGAAPAKQMGHKEPLPEFIQTKGPVRSLTNAEIEEIFLREDLERLGLDRSA